MIAELRLDNEKAERIKVAREDGKFFVTFVDRENPAPFEANFEECGQFYSVIIENKPYLVKFVEEGNVFTITSGPYTSQMFAENQEKKARRELRETFTVKVNSIETKIPGKIIDVMTKPGDIVKKGDELFILEAMKMLNRVFAPRDGIVKEIFVKKGDVLSIGNKLMSFEDIN